MKRYFDYKIILFVLIIFNINLNAQKLYPTDLLSTDELEVN